MKVIMKIAAAAAGAMMVAGGLAQPAAAGNWSKYRGHHHYKGYWHSPHRGFFHRKLVRPHYRHRRPVGRYVYVPPPRPVIIVQPYAPPRAVLVAPPGGQVASTTCREYTKTVVVDGQAVRAYGRACLQPDGSWQLVD